MKTLMLFIVIACIFAGIVLAKVNTFASALMFSISIMVSGMLYAKVTTHERTV